jgi:hypothetical protein
MPQWLRCWFGQHHWMREMNSPWRWCDRCRRVERVDLYGRGPHAGFYD